MRFLLGSGSGVARSGRTCTVSVRYRAPSTGSQHVLATRIGWDTLTRGAAVVDHRLPLQSERSAGRATRVVHRNLRDATSPAGGLPRRPSNLIIIPRDMLCYRAVTSPARPTPGGGPLRAPRRRRRLPGS